MPFVTLSFYASSLPVCMHSQFDVFTLALYFDHVIIIHHLCICIVHFDLTSGPKGIVLPILVCLYISCSPSHYPACLHYSCYIGSAIWSLSLWSVILPCVQDQSSSFHLLQSIWSLIVTLFLIIFACLTFKIFFIIYS